MGLTSYLKVKDPKTYLSRRTDFVRVDGVGVKSRSMRVRRKSIVGYQRRSPFGKDRVASGVQPSPEYQCHPPTFYRGAFYMIRDLVHGQ